MYYDIVISLQMFELFNICLNQCCKIIFLKLRSIFYRVVAILHLVLFKANIRFYVCIIVSKNHQCNKAYGLIYRVNPVGHKYIRFLLMSDFKITNATGANPRLNYQSHTNPLGSGTPITSTL